MFGPLVRAATTMVVLLYEISEDEFLSIGLQAANISGFARVKKATNIERFASYYGTSPKVCAKIWVDLQELDDGISQNENPKQFLLGLRFLKQYPTEHELCSQLGVNSPKTVRKWAKMYATKIHLLLTKKVTFIVGQIVCNCPSSKSFNISLRL